MVSVIIPLYNAEKYIMETVNSVINQTFTDWELIIINDGSTDNSEALIKDICEKDSRITYHYQVNQGVSIARNRGAKKSKGIFLAFLDADDVWDVDFLKKTTEILNNNESIVLVNANAKCIDEKSNSIDNTYYGHNENAIKDILTFAKGKVTFPSNTLCKKEAFDMAKGFNINLSNVADKMFYLNISKFGGIYHLEEYLLFYRVHKNSMHYNFELMEKDYNTMISIVEKNNYNKNELSTFIVKVYKICAIENLKKNNIFSFFRYITMAFFIRLKFNL